MKTFSMKFKDGFSGEKSGVWFDGDDILVKTEEQAKFLADLIEDLTGEAVPTGYFDPREDEIDGLTDNHTGYYYVTVS